MPRRAKVGDIYATAFMRFREKNVLLAMSGLKYRNCSKRENTPYTEFPQELAKRVEKRLGHSGETETSNDFAKRDAVRGFKCAAYACGGLITMCRGVKVRALARLSPSFVPLDGFSRSYVPPAERKSVSARDGARLFTVVKERNTVSPEVSYGHHGVYG